MDQLGKATLEDDHNMFSYLLLFPAFHVSYLRLPANGIRQSQLPEELFSSRAGKGLPVAQSSYTLCLHPPFPASAPQPESENLSAPREEWGTEENKELRKELFIFSLEFWDDLHGAHL